MGEKTFVDDIVKHSVSEQENIPWYTNSRALTPKLLGCIVNDIWNDGAVKRNLVGPSKNRRLVLNNLVRQEAEDLDQPPSGWSLICDGTTKGSLGRLEDWEFQNRRVPTEIKYEYKDGRTSYMSRVRSADHLQLLWFNRNWLLQPSDRTISECCTKFGCPVEDLTCCRKKVIDDSRLIEVMDRNDEPEDYLEYDNPDVPIVDAATMDSMVEDYFERPGFDTPIHLSLVHDQLVKHESDLAKPVVDLIDVNEILASLKVKCPTSDFAKEKNSSIELLLTCHKENVHVFANIIWYHSFLLIKSYIEENTEEVVVDMSRQRFTLVTGKFHQLLGSEVYAEYISGLWDTTEYSRVKKSISSQIAIDIYWKFMDHLSKVVKKEMEITPMQFNVQEMSAAGRAKLRHVGAWAVRKVLERSRKYVRENIFTENSYTLQKVYEQQCKCELLEEYIIVPFSQIENTTKFPETLEVTENRQYRSRGLLHISDSSYMFFVALESLRVSL